MEETSKVSESSDLQDTDTPVIVDVEKIMREIRAQIAAERAKEQVPSFDEVPIRIESAPVATGGEDWTQFMDSLRYINENYDIPYYWELGGGGFKLFCKRVVRKLCKFLIPPILAKQAEFNACVVRCVNNIRYYIETDRVKSQHLDNELEALKRQTATQAVQIKDYRETLAIVKSRLSELEAVRDQERLAVSDLSGLVAEQRQALETQGQQLAEQREALETQGQQLAEQHQALETQGQQLAEQRHALETQGQQLAEQRQVLEPQRQQLAEQQQVLAAQEQQLAEQRQTLETQEQQFAGQRELLETHESHFGVLEEHFQEAIQHTTEAVANLTRRVNTLDQQSDAFSSSVAKAFLKYKGGTQLPPEPASVEVPSKNVISTDAQCVTTYDELDYFKFQNKFRGTRALITERQEMYLPYFTGQTIPILDIGCGRGEFLRLMQKNGVPAFGVDLYPEYVVEGELSGLDVRQGDGVAYLAQSNETLGGIFAGQVIEHISFDQLISLCYHAYQRLASGAVLIMETPNPTSLSTFTSSFYIDPTHVKPIHPLTLEYLLREAGFTDIQIVYTDCSRPKQLPTIESDSIHNLNEVNDAIRKVSDMLYGSQDYAVIARKK